MGLFFKKRNKIDSDSVADTQVFLSEDTAQNNEDMVSLIKTEQKQAEIINPFVESAPTMAQKSIAKQYGDKYIGAPGRQVASSIVVDVRSYKKPEPIKPFKDLMDEEPKEEPERKKPSFFDEIMKSLDEDIDEVEDAEEEVKPPVKEEPKPATSKVVKKKTSSPRKKRVDIDIISGDFGGGSLI